MQPARAAAATRSAVAAMLGARSVAIVGASPRADTFGARMVGEVRRGAPRRIDLVNPRYTEIDGLPCVPSLRDLHEPPDLVLLGVGDRAVLPQLTAAAERGARSAVVFGSLHTPGLRGEVAAVAREAGMAVCGGGCMGFVNVAADLRATGYVERPVVAAGPVSLVTHSGSMFSALLRTRRAFGYRVAVSSGQELVTTTADYVEHVLDDPGTEIVALVLETMRDGARLRAALHRAAEQDVDVVLLAVGGSPLGAELVAAHSGAVAGADAAWEALSADADVRRVADLAELTDTLELLALARRRWHGRRRQHGGELATVHDSGAERTLVADTAHALGVPFAAIDDRTRTVLGGLLDDGLDATNPLDLWGTGAETRALFGKSLLAMAEDPAVGAVALAIDLVAEYDDDTSYPDAALDAAARSPVPVAVLANLPSAVDEPTAARLREAGVAVLEGTRSGMIALRHLLTPRPEMHTGAVRVDEPRRARWRTVLAEADGPLDAATSFALLADYGVPVVRARPVDSALGALTAACELGWPVVLKTDAPGMAHKSDAGGVRLGIADEDAMWTAYAEIAARFGPRAVVCEQVDGGAEFSVGLVADPQLGPLVVVAAGGVLVEVLADRSVALPPLDEYRARGMIDSLRAGTLLDGFRGVRAGGHDALARVITAVSQIGIELCAGIAALDINPVIVSPGGAIAVDALVVRSGGGCTAAPPHGVLDTPRDRGHDD